MNKYTQLFKEAADRLLNDIPENAKYFVLIYEDGSKTEPEGLYDFPHNKDYFERNNLFVNVKDFIESIVAWNKHNGCIGYEFLDDNMKVVK